jgi:hypothetical protein
LAALGTHILQGKTFEQLHTCFLDEMEEKEAPFSETGSLDTAGTHLLRGNDLEKLQTCCLEKAEEKADRFP